MPPGLSRERVPRNPCSGVSAAEAGREASETCVSNFLSDYFSTPESWSVGKSAQQVLTALNRWLYGQGRGLTDSHKGYVSTFSAVIFKSYTAHLLHAGDCRVYRLRGGELEQLTRDHCTVISEQQTYLSRALGLDVQLDVDYRQLPLAVGDLYLLSSDGLHDFLPRGRLRHLLAEAGADLEAACQRLLDAALICICSLPALAVNAVCVLPVLYAGGDLPASDGLPLHGFDEMADWRERPAAAKLRVSKGLFHTAKDCIWKPVSPRARASSDCC